MSYFEAGMRHITYCRVGYDGRALSIGTLCYAWAAKKHYSAAGRHKCQLLMVLLLIRHGQRLPHLNSNAGFG